MIGKYLPEQYITHDIAARTKYKSIKDAYNRNNLSVIIRGSFWYVESCTQKVFKTLYKEMKRLYPMYTYLFEEMENNQ